MGTMHGTDQAAGFGCSHCSCAHVHKCDLELHCHYAHLWGSVALLHAILHGVQGVSYTHTLPGKLLGKWDALHSFVQSDI